jgi:hypothetical protein
VNQKSGALERLRLLGGGGSPRKRAVDRGRTTRASVCRPPFRENRAPLILCGKCLVVGVRGIKQRVGSACVQA